MTKEKLQGLFGLPLEEIGEKLFLSVPKEASHKVIEDCCVYECEYLAEHNGVLYDKLEETLQKLRERFRLFIVSNCQEGYIQCFFRANKTLEKYFEDYEYPGRSGKLKADNIRMIIERNGLKNPIYVGDTTGDAEACRKAGVPFCFAAYGFGEVSEYTEKIESFQELTKFSSV